MELTELIAQVGGAGAIAWAITGAIKTAFKIPSTAKALIALVVGAVVGIGLAFLDGSVTPAELVAGAFGGVAAILTREGFKSLIRSS